jgi:hypothetical protein
VLEEIQRVRKAEVYAVTDDALADAVLSLPDLLVNVSGSISGSDASSASTSSQDTLAQGCPSSRAPKHGF